MRTFKKIIAILVTLSMLLGAVALTASAGEAPVVVLVGRTQMEKDDFYYADLVIMGEDVGGVQGTITYDTTVFDYEGVEFTEEFDAVNKRTGDDNVFRVDETAGTIAFIGINPGKEIVWFTLKFKAVALSDNATFTIGDDALKLKASKADGKELYYETFVVVPDVVEVVEPDQVDMLGATIKAEAEGGKQDIKFEAQINYTGDKEIAEYGVIFIPSQLLPKGTELNCDPTTVYNYNSSGNPVYAAVASSTVSYGNDFQLFATLTGSSSFKAGALLQVDISARAYIKFADGKVIYSNNDYEITAINDGYARKSIIGIAKSMATFITTQTEMDVDYSEVGSDTVNTILATQVLDDTQEEALLKFVNLNAEILKLKTNNQYYYGGKTNEENIH